MKPRPILFPQGPLPWLKPALFVGSLVPFAVMILRAARGALGADPVAASLNQLGLLALVFLLASLACTPMGALLKSGFFARVRRMFGLFSLFYAALHFCVYAALDQGLGLRAIAEDIAQRPFILVGTLTLVLLIPLGVTSTARTIKRMGYARWKRLHRLAYAAGVFAVVHFVLRVKKDLREPLAYAVILGLLFAARVAFALGRARKKGAVPESPSQNERIVLP